MSIKLWSICLQGKEWSAERADQFNTFFSAPNNFPDIVCIQSMHESMFDTIARTFSQRGYMTLRPDELKYSPYINTIHLNRKASGEFIELTDSPLSGITKTVYVMGDTQLTVLTCKMHRMGAIRTRQFSALSRVIKKLNADGMNYVLAGDFGFNGHSEQSIDAVDAWYEAGSDSAKYTLDSDKNQIFSPPRSFKERPDRVYLSENVFVESYDLVGVSNPISSHYGICVDLKID